MPIIPTFTKPTRGQSAQCPKEHRTADGDGKARSSQNAFKHGLSAKTPLLPGEDPAEFAAFSEALIEDLAPQGAIEAYLVNALRRSPGA